MVEFTFIEPLTGQEVYVRVDPTAGEVEEVYTDRGSNVVREAGFVWSEREGSQFVYCDRRREVVEWLGKEYVLSLNEEDAWESIPGLPAYEF